MIKSDLIQKMYAMHPQLYQQDIDRVVNIILKEIIETLKHDGRVELCGFGAFSIKARSGRMGRNPRTGSSVEVAARNAAACKPGKEVRAHLNSARDEAAPTGDKAFLRPALAEQ